MTKSWLQCIKCGKKQDLYRTRKFECACGGLYDVIHDFSSLKKKGATECKKLFDDRTQPGPEVRHNSGVWRFHELIMPSIRPDEIVSLGEGILPFWQAGQNLKKWVGGDLDLWIIPEGLTPTGSFKDFGGTVAFSVAKKAGIKTVACASTGDTSAMAAAYAAAAGISCAVFLPKGQVTGIQVDQLRTYGAKVVMIPGSFDDCMRIVRQLALAERIFPINSINPTRIEGHQASVFLVAQFFNWSLPAAFVVPVGNGSNSSSIGKGMRVLADLGLVKNHAKLIGVQSEAANPLAKSWKILRQQSRRHNQKPTIEEWQKIYEPIKKLGQTTATAARIGDPVSKFKVMREVLHSGGEVLTAKETELNEAVMIATRDGHFVCPQTGTALAGLRQAVKKGFIKKGQRVVVIGTATGLKFSNVAQQYADPKLIIEAKSCEVEEAAKLIGI